MRKVWFLITVLVVLSMLASACAAPTPTATPLPPTKPPAPTATPKPSRLPAPNDVKALLVQLVDVEKRVPGIVVGMIAADPQERWVVGYGRLSATDERIPDGDTVYEIGSITKVFTGILLAQAVINGEVKLDDPISMYLPEGVTAPEYEGRSITLLDLATHYSALPTFCCDNLCEEYTMDQLYYTLSGYQLTRAPGSKWEYSNFGFGLLGDLLARRAGKADYEALLLERITRPLGMDSTRIELTPEMRSRLATPHENYYTPSCSNVESALFGAGGIRSTANDMLKFLAANMGLTETELQPAMQLANTPQRPTDGPPYIGLGCNLTKSGNGIHQHGGGTMGYTSFLGWDTERKIGVVVLMNVFDGPNNQIGFQLLRGLPKPFLVDPQVLAEYAGRYQDSDGVIVTVRVDGSRIFVQETNYPEYELLASSENQFYVGNAEITFCRNDRGEVDRQVVVSWGETHEAKKVP
jgi:D-alanyl-D-alanine-carboxypeptidase/D-alanyl-D-alanine-endopeptidase